jgi:hypothetical protein
MCRDGASKRHAPADRDDHAFAAGHAHVLPPQGLETHRHTLRQARSNFAAAVMLAAVIIWWT